jgi:hypothetical protein
MVLEDISDEVKIIRQKRHRKKWTRRTRRLHLLPVGNIFVIRLLPKS